MVYSVIIDISNGEVDKVFDYHAPFKVEVGSRVLVPFGRQQLEGFVIGTKEKSDYETKDIILILDEFIAIKPELLALMQHLKENDNLRYIDCLRLFIPSKLRGGKVKISYKNFIMIDSTINIDEVMAGIKPAAKAQRSVLEYLCAERSDGEWESQLNADFSPSAIKALVEKGILLRMVVEAGRVPYKGIVAERKNIVLTDEQNHAIERILNGGNNEFLIHGVTGSGKTEIYMNVIEKMLAIGKSAIMLVPEISLTPQMLGVFRARFGDFVSLLHSGLSDGERFDEWRKLLMGKAKVALGARSAIFAPLDNVGVIIIDEEHDSSYVSENNPRYFTENIARFRANYCNGKLILGSATPSMDTYQKAKVGKLELITLKYRANQREMPAIETIDMRKEVKSGNLSMFSRILLKELDETLKAENQAMIFINRRGYVSFLRCRSCGYTPKCEDCDISLTFHREDNRLKCHYCGKNYQIIEKCPECGFAHLKEGKIGTEKVASEIKRIFPKARVLRMDNDTTTSKDSYVNILTSFAKREADILVGTQMIAKGHDFKDVTLVGILDADIALYFSDYRSNERTFQLITQVAGRAGREKKAGKVILQTFNPNHYVFKFAERYDYENFFLKEINTREMTKFPPFSTIIRVLVLSDDEQKATVGTRTYYDAIKIGMAADVGVFRIQGMRAPIKRIQKNYRFQIVVWLNSDAIASIKKLYEITKNINIKGVVAFTEVNPQHMM